MLPSYFKDIFQTSQPVADLNTRSRNYVILNQPNTVLARESVRYKVPQIILNVPNCISDKITTHSVDGFNEYVKNYIISNYVSYCQEENCYICQLST